MIATSRQLKDLIRNLSKKTSTEAYILIRNQMMERFLERLSVSQYKNCFILKGGMLIAGMVGIDSRSTMDIDATITGFDVTPETVRHVVEEIIAIDLADNVSFEIKAVRTIMDDFEYPGVRVSLESQFDGMRTPIKIDISTGDAIIPSAIQYELPLMLENRSIQLYAYNLETVLAEKMETVLSRGVTNTRMRDFYDIHVLLSMKREQINKAILIEAFQVVVKNRNMEKLLLDSGLILNEVSDNTYFKELWNNYRNSFAYAKDMEWETAMSSINELAKILHLIPDVEFDD